MRDCDAIPKNGYNSFSKYKYVMASDVISEVSKLMVKHGVILVTKEIELTRESHGKNFHSTLKSQGIFRNIDCLTDVVTYDYYSISADTLDKDIFKSKTNGLKYLFTQAFQIVTGDVIDTEQDKPQNKPPVQGQPANKPTGRTTEVPICGCGNKMMISKYAKTPSEYYYCGKCKSTKGK